MTYKYDLQNANIIPYEHSPVNRFIPLAFGIEGFSSVCRPGAAGRAPLLDLLRDGSVRPGARPTRESAGLEAGEESAGLVEGGKSAGLAAGDESAGLVGVIVGATVGGLAALILAIALPIVVICCCRKKVKASPPSTAVPATQGVAMPVAKSAPAIEQASIEA